MRQLKRITLFLGFLLIWMISVGGKEAAVNDQLDVFSDETTQLVETRNKKFQLHHENAQILLQSGKSSKATNPKKNEIVIFVTQKVGKKNIEISIGENLKKIIPTTKSIMLVQALKQQLKSSNDKTFNFGVQKLINSTASLINEHYHIKDKNDLSKKELNDLNHPQNMKMIWAIAIGIFVVIALAWYQNFKIKH